MWLDRAAFGDADSEAVGSGWWSGVLSVFLGLLAFGAVLCLHFPALLTSPDLREHYPMPLMRIMIQATIVAAFGCGVVNDPAGRRTSATWS